MGRTDEFDVAGVSDDVLDAVVGFVRRLRTAGVAVPADAAIVATESLAEIGLDDETRVRAAMQATLLTRERDIETFERLFAGFWMELRAHVGGRGVDDDRAEVSREIGSNVPGGAPSGNEPEGSDTGVERVDDSGVESSEESGTAALSSGSTVDRRRVSGSFELSRYSPAGEPGPVEESISVGRPSLAVAVDRLTNALVTIPGRRRTRTTSGRFVDARRALRSSFQTGGVVATVPETDLAESAVRGTVLVDVSQSVLDSVDRGFLLEWLWLLADQWRSLRVFFFDTDVREVTDAFDERTVGNVPEALARAEAEWGGGTRIGHAFSTVQDAHPGAVDNRTVVLVVSDGLERGEVADLRESAAWFSRRGRLLLWLNPLAVSPEYEPTARGMAAALPAVDGLFAFAGVDDVAELASQLERHERTRLGYEYDSRRS